MKDVLLKLREVKNADQKSALCIIVSTKGSSPRKIGTKMIVYEDASQEGTIGGGSLELKVIEDALLVIKENLPKKISYQLEEDLGMSCGGQAEVYIEPIYQNSQLVIFGGGHVGKALIKYASDFGFDITLVDHRSDYISPLGEEKISFVNKDYVEAIDEIQFTESTFVVIVTPKHAFDEAILEKVGKFECAYIGMIGSKNKVKKAKTRLLEENILTESEIDKIDMPIGIKFNAQTPEEIAISILAKLIHVKNMNQ